MSPFPSVDTVLTWTFLYPLAAAALPVVATANTLAALLRRPGFSKDAEEEPTRTIEQEEAEEDAYQRSTAELSRLAEDALNVDLKPNVEVRVFDEQGQQQVLRDREVSQASSGGYDDRFNSYASNWGQGYASANTSPSSTLPSHFRSGPISLPSLSSLFSGVIEEQDAASDVDESFDGEQIAGEWVRSTSLAQASSDEEGSMTPLGSARDRTRSDTATIGSGPPSAYSTMSRATGIQPNLGFSPSRPTAAFTPFHSLSFYNASTISRPTIPDPSAFDSPDRSFADSIDRSSASNESFDAEGASFTSDADYPAVDIPSHDQVPLQPAHSDPVHFGEPFHTAPGSTSPGNFSFSSPVIGGPEPTGGREEDAGLITPRASPVMLTWPVLEGEQRKISAQKMAEDDVLEEERRGRQRRRTSEAEHEVHDELRTDKTLLPSPPSTPPVVTAASLLSRATESVEHTPTTSHIAPAPAIDEIEIAQFASFLMGGGAEGSDGLGMALDLAKENVGTGLLAEEAAQMVDANVLRHVEPKASLEEAFTRRTFRDHLQTDRPISTVSTSSTHAHLGSPQFPYFLPMSHSKPHLSASSGINDDDGSGSAVSTLRLDHSPVAGPSTAADMDEEIEGEVYSPMSSPEVPATPDLGGGTGSEAGGEGKKKRANAYSREKKKKNKKKKKGASAGPEDSGTARSEDGEVVELGAVVV